MAQFLGYRNQTIYPLKKKGIALPADEESLLRQIFQHKPVEPSDIRLDDKTGLNQKFLYPQKTKRVIKSSDYFLAFLAFRIKSNSSFSLGIFSPNLADLSTLNHISFGLEAKSPGI